MNLNLAIIIGRLARDPELKALPNGTAVASFSVATTHRRKDKNTGEQVETTDWHNVQVFGTMAENAAKYLKKGQLVQVDGRMTTRSWDKTDGTKGYRFEIIAEDVQYGPKVGGDSSNGDRPQTTGRVVKGPAVATGDADVDTIEYPDEEINPEDIPF